MSLDLLLGAPIAWARYFLGSPALVGLLSGVAALLAALVGGAKPGAEASPLGPADLAPALLIAAVESAVLLRVMLVGLIEERNFTLARHMRAASMQVLAPPRALRQRGPGRDGRALWWRCLVWPT